MNNSNSHNLEHVLSQLAEHDRPLLAGGTDFFPALQDRPAPTHVTDISRIEELRAIQHEEAGWRVGAACTWSDIINADLPPAFNALKAAGHEVGSVQIQNAATAVGNVCNASPAADGVPPLLALDARLEIRSSSDTRVVLLQDFLKGVRQTDLQRGELVTAILIPEHVPNTISHFRKLGARSYLVISIAMLAITIETDDAGMIHNARIAVGSCSPVARRLSGLESDLIGCSLADKDLTRLVRSSHLDVLSPIDDIRASAAYRLHAVEELLRRMLAQCALDAHAFAA